MFRGIVLLLFPVLLTAQLPDIGTPPAAPGMGKPGPISPREAGPVTWYDTSNRANVRNLYNTIFAPSRSVPLGWTGDVAAGVWGNTSQAYKDAVAQRINWLRAMAGAPAAITLNSTYNGKAQQAAMMMSANKQLNHFPPSSWTNYTAEGAEAAQNSNLCLGFSNDPGCLELYMFDHGSGNSAAGHRRWILYPQTMQFGTGDVPATSSGGYPSANALWVFDGNYGTSRPDTREEFVAWPSPGYFPYQLEPIRWSFSYPGADFTGATVTMTRGGVVVPAVLENVANGYGENTLVWYASGANPSAYPTPTAPSSDTTVHVQINNVTVNGSARQFVYDVIIFDPSTSGSAQATPVSVSVNPSSGSGGRRVFQFVSRDADGANDLWYAQFNFSPVLSGYNACYVHHDPATNVFYLLNDDGSQWFGLYGGSNADVTNGQCVVHGLTSGSSKSGTDLTTSLDVSFRSAFAGSQKVYLFSADKEGHDSGWQQVGTWTASGDPALTEFKSMSPSAGSGSSQLFTLTLTDQNGGNTIWWTQINFNSALSGYNACYIHYDAAYNVFYLLNDNATQWYGMFGNTSTSIENSQCRLKGIGSGSAAAGNDLAVTYNLEFKPGFAGAKNIYVQGSDQQGNFFYWKKRGTFTVQ